ncbi:HAD family phosphatase [Sulfitobacter sp. M57]|uniref:HAD family hydrolase n=1 Tax=unclassified Sulfitobacter TaxID=196795 RepID=UPI0023E0A94C|nr:MULTISPECIES: HAD family phosphatase [unclassified Sulfitobacter]MDF3415288.1 HAD family phosphatase [Sulfitobacter sp. KE5]MDF3422769.1 HAD family phosphatase [Sulfitobacter sp. KE43]MDF3433834.1 HAD family phosphatase [Sulfitobacter sp. KE42]MDF3459474.1 HAD family phosphatase [Sulfitobacter sp. S74]MDF3463373.1 HAD family phosphatase [Sulfitobacter sp. Ks18]
MKPQAVVFDIGNVLIEWHPERFFDSVIGPDRRRAMFAAVDLHAMNDRVDIGETFREVIVATAQATPDWQDEIMLWHDRWLDMASPAIDHSVRLMAALQARGVPVFSLTNFGIQTYDLAATRYPFLRQFDRDFISGHLGMIKPDAGIYAALETTSGLSGAALLFTDDRPENIAAAAKRGWQTHHFTDPQGWADRLVAAGLLSKDDAQ